MHTVLSQKEKFKGSKFKTFLRKTLYFTQNRVISWFSRRIFVHANFFKDILVKEYGVSPKKIVVLPQGILEDVPKYDKNKIKKELGLSGQVLLFMGSMVPDHGHDIIVKQAGKIGKTILIVANPGSVNDRNSDRTRKYLDEVKEIVKKDHLEKFVKFDISDITDKSPMWWKYFAASDLVMLPYRGGIGSGIFAHSMAAQRPVIASNIKFFNEIAKHWGCVVVAKSENDFSKQIKDSLNASNLSKMEKECKRYLAEFGLSSLAKKYQKVYSEIK